MGVWIADALHERRKKAGSALVLGLTFKEDVADLRNSRSFDLVRRLQWLGHDVSVAEPLADPAEIAAEHGLAVTAVGERRYDLVVGAVGHREYRELSDEQIESMIAPGGTLADLKGVWRDRKLGDAIDRWTL